MSVSGFVDARELADILDVRASTIRELVRTNSELIPQPVRVSDRLLTLLALGITPDALERFPDREEHAKCGLDLWPFGAVKSWLAQGRPLGFTYDIEEFCQLAVCGSDGAEDRD